MLSSLHACVRRLNSCGVIRTLASKASGDHASVSLDFPAYAIWSPNTDVGKSLVSAGLAKALQEAQVRRLNSLRACSTMRMALPASAVMANKCQCASSQLLCSVPDLSCAAKRHSPEHLL